MIYDELPIYGFTIGSAACAAVAGYPFVARVWSRLAGGIEQLQQVKVERTAKVLDELFVDVPPRWLKVAYGLGPLCAGLLAYLVLNRAGLALLGMVLGALVPDLLVRRVKAIRKRRFHDQLVDALFILSSGLRAGLSLTQAFEQLETEIGPPASQEFGLMMKAHRLGLTLEESLQRLNERMPSEEMTLITTAVLVARESGGDITHIITQLIATIRERKKLKDKVTTLTLQGRLQAYIMSGLPFLFAAFVRSSNPHYFDLLLRDATGQVILMAAAGLWVVGMVLLIKLSRVDI
ncbi:MAG: type II secretion system F family protein [Candidatus Omnitrophica bacterium]|nr:type II secretion system F family protein [Candidatus Omnitrophota bacterium]MBI3020770.1 type II secretion system F family protein [Candidatus Omnitrophota bacterium]